MADACGWGSLTPEGIATAEVTLPGQMAGTISYMSPEQIQGQSVDGRSDLFAFALQIRRL